MLFWESGPTYEGRNSCVGPKAMFLLYDNYSAEVSARVSEHVEEKTERKKKKVKKRRG